jgi:hypothetical protein
MRLIKRTSVKTGSPRRIVGVLGMSISTSSFKAWIFSEKRRGMFRRIPFRSTPSFLAITLAKLQLNS